NRLMIIVPSLYLIEQTRKYFVQTETDREKNMVINFCSINETGTKALKYTTSEIELQKYIDNFNESENKNMVVIVTYNSVEKCISVFQQANFQFDMFIFDEAHTVVNEDRARSNWFYDNHATFPCDKQLFM